MRHFATQDLHHETVPEQPGMWVKLFFSRLIGVTSNIFYAIELFSLDPTTTRLLHETGAGWF